MDQNKKTIVFTMGVLLAAGMTTVTVKTINRHRSYYPWQVRNCNSGVLRRVPPQVGIAPARYPNTLGAGSTYMGDGQVLGIAETVNDILQAAYGQDSARTIILDSVKLPNDKYDFIANLRSGNEKALQSEIKMKFGLIGRFETRDTDALLLEIQTPDAFGLKPANPQKREHNSLSSSRSSAGYFSCRNQPLSDLAWFLENKFNLPVIDQQPRSTNCFDIDLKWDEPNYQHPNLDALKQALSTQLGLKLVPTNMPIKMLIIDKAK